MESWLTDQTFFEDGFLDFVFWVCYNAIERRILDDR